MQITKTHHTLTQKLSPPVPTPTKASSESDKGPLDQVNIETQEPEESLGQKIGRYSASAGKFLAGATSAALLGSLGAIGGATLGTLYLGTILPPLASLSLNPGDRSSLLATRAEREEAKRDIREDYIRANTPLAGQVLEGTGSLAQDLGWQISAPVRWSLELCAAGTKKGFKLFN